MLALAGLAGLLALSGAAVYAQDGEEPTAPTWGTACTWLADDYQGMADGVVDFRLNENQELDRSYYATGQTGVEIRTRPEDYILPYATNLRDAQKAELSVPLWADIPCCLKMKFKGNSINAFLGSVGPSQEASIVADDFQIAFLPALGGLVDKDWAFLAGSQDPNCEDALYCGENFIRSCDTYEVELWSNLAYKYSVKAANGGYLVGPVPGGTANLELDMRSYWEFDSTGPVATVWDTYNAWAWTDAGAFSNYTNAKVDVLANVPAMTYSKVWHQFRVPMNTVPAGSYKGKLTFTAMTI